MKETIIYEDPLGTHTVTGEVIEELKLHITVSDGDNELYILKSHIKQRLDDEHDQISLGVYI